jgi:hypothetical protein
MSGLAHGLRVRIVRRPPSRMLEGVDLSTHAFEEGGVYQVDAPVANVLILWEYAEPINDSASDRSAVPRRRG